MVPAVSTTTEPSQPIAWKEGKGWCEEQDKECVLNRCSIEYCEAIGGAPFTAEEQGAVVTTLDRAMQVGRGCVSRLLPPPGPALA